MIVERPRPQGAVRGPFPVHLVGADDLPLTLLDGDELAKLGRLGQLPFANRFGVRVEDAEHFVGHVRVAAQHAGAGLGEDASRQGPGRLRKTAVDDLHDEHR